MQHAVKLSFDQAARASDKNPKFLNNAELKDFLKVSDCSQVRKHNRCACSTSSQVACAQVSDGGAALVVVSEDGLKALGKKKSDAIEVLFCFVFVVVFLFLFVRVFFV